MLEIESELHKINKIHNINSKKKGINEISKFIKRDRQIINKSKEKTSY